MAAPEIKDYNSIIPTMADFAQILSRKLQYEKNQGKPSSKAWNDSHFSMTPWGIAYIWSKAKRDKSIAYAASRGWDRHGGYKPPEPKNDCALKGYIIALVLDWKELADQLKRTLTNWGYTARDIQYIADEVWLKPENTKAISDAAARAIAASDITSITVEEQLETHISTVLSEAVEKHDSLNPKLFTKDELLKASVKNKLLEIVDEFIEDLKEQEIKIKIDDILLIGSNASYNYTKDSDIDLHILTNVKATGYDSKLCGALYGAFRTIFNKNFDIKVFDIPVEIFVETEESARASNGVYSVKKNKWVKKPVIEEIPDYDKDALEKLVSVWETKYKKIEAEIKDDKLKNETKVVKLLEDIYEKLRKKGIAKGEYAIENLAFKELRNKGYLDKLKEYKNTLTSKRLSLEERLSRQELYDKRMQITRAANGNQPIIQENGMFFIYNLKASDVSSVVRALRQLPFVVEVNSHENGKYDFSNTLELAMNKMPSRYYDIRGRIN